MGFGMKGSPFIASVLEHRENGKKEYAGSNVCVRLAGKVY